MDRATVWKNLFTDWPETLPRKGVVVTVGNEAIPYHEFLVHSDVVLLQRRAPDTMGAREVIVPFGEISVVKMTEVVRPATYREAGFAGAKTA